MTPAELHKRHWERMSVESLPAVLEELFVWTPPPPDPAKRTLACVVNRRTDRYYVVARDPQERVVQAWRIRRS